jgi:hypothetical protein
MKQGAPMILKNAPFNLILQRSLKLYIKLNRCIQRNARKWLSGPARSARKWGKRERRIRVWENKRREGIERKEAIFLRFL